MDDVLSLSRDKMNKVILALKKELASVRAGRANAAVLDKILVDYYGTPTPINQLGNISIPEARLLQIALWDVKAMSLVEKAIQKSDIGINPMNDGKVIRLVFPELTEERRRELVKQIKKYAEEYKVTVRSVRRDANEQLKKQKSDSDITEDDLKLAEKEMQKMTDDAIKDIDVLVAAKEKEIMEI